MQFVCSLPIQTAARYGRPFSDRPLENKTVVHVRVVPCKRFGHFAAGTVEEQDGFVDWVRQRTAQDQFTTFRSLFSECKVLLSKGRSPRDVVVDYFVDEQKVFVHLFVVLSFSDFELRQDHRIVGPVDCSPRWLERDRLCQTLAMACR